MVLHSGKISEMKTGEGKTLVATLPAYLNALEGKGVHLVTVNDYLAKRDSEWMGRIYKALGTEGGRDRPRPGRQRAQGSLRRRHHLRHQQRIRLRLPARQHEVPHRGLHAARPPLRHRGRSGFHSDRRSPHPADHFRPLRRVHRQVLQGQPHHPQAGARRGDRRQGAGRKVHHRRLHHRRKAQDRGAHRGGRSQGGAAAEHRQPVRPRQHRVQPPRAAGPARPRAVPARPRIRHQGRRRRPGSHHRRRIHRPPDARPPLVGRSAPGGGSQGRRQDPAREPDPGHHHLPELLPHVQEAGRHDRHGGNRSGRISEDLQARRHRGPHQPRLDPPGESGRGVPHRGGEVPQRRRRDQADPTKPGSRCWWAPSPSRSPKDCRPF